MHLKEHWKQPSKTKHTVVHPGKERGLALRLVMLCMSGEVLPSDPQAGSPRRAVEGELGSCGNPQLL